MSELHGQHHLLGGLAKRVNPRRRAEHFRTGGTGGLMFRMLMTGALVGLLGASAVQADTLDISIDAQGAAYNNMVADAKLRGDGGGGIEDANLGAGAGSGSVNRFYANFLLDGTTPSSRLNTFVQRFDVSSIPAGSTINSAVLTQWFSNSTANNRTFEALKLSQLRPGKGWIEGV